MAGSPPKISFSSLSSSFFDSSNISRVVLLFIIALGVTLLARDSLSQAPAFVTSLSFVGTTVFVLILPGWLLLRQLDLHPTTLGVYVVLLPVLSVAVVSLTLFVWFLGFSIFEIPHPLTANRIYLAIALLIIGLLAHDLITHENQIPFSEEVILKLRHPALIVALFAFSTAIVGARLTTAGIANANLVLFATLLLASITPLFLRKWNAPLCTDIIIIYVTALALLFHMSLVSNYVWGPDIQWTLHYATLIKSTNTLPLNVASHRAPLTTVTLVPAVLSDLSGLSIDWVYKIYLQLLMSLMPVGVYLISRKLISREWAVLAPFGYIFYQRFIHGIQAKQHFGQVFIITLLLILLFAYSWKHRNVILLFLAWGLLTSHYLMTVLFLGMTISYVVGIRLINLLPPKGNVVTNRVGPEFIAILFISFIAWYSRLSNGFKFRQSVMVPYLYFHNFFQRATTTSGRKGSSLIVDTFQLGTIRKIYFLLYVFLIGLLLFGTLIAGLRALFKRDSSNWRAYILFSIPPIAFFTLSIVVSLGFGIDRALEVLFLTASPLTIAGAYWLSRGAKKYGLPVKMSHFQSGLAIVLALFLLFNLGAVHFALGLQTDPNPVPRSFALDQDKPWGDFNEQEIAAAKWAISTSPTPQKFYTSFYGTNILGRYQDRWAHPKMHLQNEYYNSNSGTLFIRNYNVPRCPGSHTFKCLDTTEAGNKIYTNNHSTVFMK